jgi:hypothetical protein
MPCCLGNDSSRPLVLNPLMPTIPTETLINLQFLCPHLHQHLPVIWISPSCFLFIKIFMDFNNSLSGAWRAYKVRFSYKVECSYCMFHSTLLTILAQVLCPFKLQNPVAHWN